MLHTTNDERHAPRRDPTPVTDHNRPKHMLNGRVPPPGNEREKYGHMITRRSVSCNIIDPWSMVGGVGELEMGSIEIRTGNVASAIGRCPWQSDVGSQPPRRRCPSKTKHNVRSNHVPRWLPLEQLVATPSLICQPPASQGATPAEPSDCQSTRHRNKHPRSVGVDH